MVRYNRIIRDTEHFMKAVNTEVKGNLARLLATENLHVEHRKISTAYFDVQRRVLALPIWKDVTGDVYDLLVGHEVGHALYTPNQSFGNAPKDFVNVLEDARIERKMKVTYPGLRKSFFKGYRELNDRDFFAIRGVDLSEMNLIDRINLYFKVGNDIPFKEEEKVWIQRAENTVTFEDVVTLAEELHEYIKKQQEPAPEMPEMDLPEDTKDPTGDPGGSGEGGDQSEDSEPSDDDSTDRSDSGDDKDADPDLDTPSYQEQFGDADPTESLTNQAFERSQQDLIDDNAKEWIYLDLPKFDLKSIVVESDKIQEVLRNHFYHIAEERVYSREKSFSAFKKYKKDSAPSVNYLVKQFEMKKSADEYKRATTAKSGVLDTNSLYKYKLTEDIFKKVTTVSEGKNHGLVFQLDWSGSMSNCLMDTLRQLYNLIWFCKKAQIPFEVYAFQSTGYNSLSPWHPTTQQKEINTVYIGDDFHLLKLFHSKMKQKDLDEMMMLVWAQCYGMANNYYTAHGYSPHLTLGGTPLAEAVICTREIVTKFKRANNVQKVNVICLSDGEANPMGYVVEKRYNYHQEEYWASGLMCHRLDKVFILRDPVTKYQRKINQSPYTTTKEIVSFFREITDYNWIGFRLCNKREAMGMISDIDQGDYAKSWQKDKFVEVKDLLGFSVQYIIPNRNIGTGTEDLEVKAKNEVATKAELQRAFKKHMGSKMTNKTILNKFVEVIA